VTFVSTILLLSACSGTQHELVEPELVKVASSKIYLVRHAEKLSGQGKDPDLARVGKERADALAVKLAEVELDHIYSTDYKRTMMTATPTAKQQNLEIEKYSIPLYLLANKIKQLHKEQTILVVGHSNTTPQLIKALGIAEPVQIDHNQYGDLYIVELTETGATLMVDKFGL